jgi:hypothetical protein
MRPPFNVDFAVREFYGKATARGATLDGESGRVYAERCSAVPNRHDGGEPCGSRHWNAKLEGGYACARCGASRGFEDVTQHRRAYQVQPAGNATEAHVVDAVDVPAASGARSPTSRSA